MSRKYIISTITLLCVPFLLILYFNFMERLQYHTEIYNKKSLYVNTQLCNDPLLRSQLEGETECDYNIRYLKVSASERSLFEMAQSFILCDNDRCDSLLGKLSIIAFSITAILLCLWAKIVWNTLISYNKSVMSLPHTYSKNTPLINSTLQQTNTSQELPIEYNYNSYNKYIKND
jgi:hypothetical protein